jgi:hypothetical protein
MPVRSLALALLLACAAVAGAVEGSNAAGLKITATVTKQTERWLILSLVVENSGGKNIQFKNVDGEKIGGLRAKVGERDVPAEGGKWKWAKAAAAKLTAFEAGVKTDLEAKFKFEPDLAGKEYDWTVTVTNLFVDDKKVDDVVISSKAPAKKD